MRRPGHRSLLIALSAFAGGLVAQSTLQAAVGETAYEKLAVFTRVLTYVQNSYVEEVDATRLIYGAIEGMMDTLDPHSVFLTPEAYRDAKADTGGEFGGVGLEVTREGERLLVVAPLDDTPAAAAGIVAGDEIVTVDGEAAAGLSLPEAVRRLRGPAGSRVVLGVLRSGFRRPVDVPLRRARIVVHPVVAELREGFGVVRIRAFQERTEPALREALAELRTRSGGQLAGVVLDLRDNPGGLLDEAVRVADVFLSEGIIVSTRGRTGPEEVQRAHARNTEPGYPLVVLVNGGSASAAEIVAGALQDHRRAVLLGTRTFGKGSVQTLIDLDDGSGLKLTVARYHTPSGRSIHAKGIDPDVPVPAAGEPTAPRRAGLRADKQSDPQLRAALEALRTRRQAAERAQPVPSRAAAR